MRSSRWCENEVRECERRTCRRIAIEGLPWPGLPAVLEKARKVFIVKVVFPNAGDGIVHLNECAEMSARQSVAQIHSHDIGNPVVERGASGIRIHTAALEQIDQQFMNEIDVHAHLQRVWPMNAREDIRNLVTVLVRK